MSSLLASALLASFAVSASPAPQGRIVAVCPPALQESLTPWVTRRTEQGWQVELIAPADDAAAVKEDIRMVATSSASPLRHVVLWGDCNYGASPLMRQARSTRVPTFHETASVTPLFGSTEKLASDAPYGDLDGDGVPEVSVGRIPVDSRTELKQYVERLIRYEESTDFSDWRRRINLVAGVGGFGFVADTAIESATRAILSNNLPDAVDVNVTYASPSSPYFPGVDRFHRTTIDGYNAGGLAWVYVGHGWIGELDRVPGTPGNKPILSTEDVAKLNRHAASAPIALMLACYTGAYDAPTDCLAERMLLADGGPIAVIAGTRMTLPYGNAELAQQLIKSWFDDRVPTIGDAMHSVRGSLTRESNSHENASIFELLASVLSPHDLPLATERREHASLFNLLGDPSMALPSFEPLAIRSPSLTEAGETIAVEGNAEVEGTLMLELCWPRDRVPPNEGNDSHRSANREVITTVRHRVQPGPFSLSLPVPATLQGKLLIRGTLVADNSLSLGSATLLVVPKT